MHQAPLQFIKSVLEIAEPKGMISVLEVGSYDVNGSIRAAVRQSPMGNHLGEYIGIDLTKGPGVDIVASGDELAIEDSRFDLVLSLECFEHNPRWRGTLVNMIRMLKPGGWCIVTCASLGRPEHGTSRMDITSSPGTAAQGWDYYKNVSLADFRAVLPFDETFDCFTLSFGAAWNDLYFVGRKRGNPAHLCAGGDLASAWGSASRSLERPSLKRRMAYLMEYVLGSRAFQSFYVTIWRSFKPSRPRS